MNWTYLFPVVKHDPSIVPPHKRVGLERCGPRGLPVVPSREEWLPKDGQQIVAQAVTGEKKRTTFRRTKDTPTEAQWVEPFKGSEMFRWKPVEEAT